MSTVNIFQISFEIWGCIISIIICLLLGGHTFRDRDEVGKCLWRMLLVNVLLLSCDALAYIYRGDQSPIGLAMTRVSNFSLYVLEYLLLGLFACYVRQLTGGGPRLRAWWERVACGFLALGLACLIITQFTGLYYSFDSTNHYQRGSGIWISFAVGAAVVFACVVRLWACRAQLSKTARTTIALCVGVFAVCILGQFVFYGLSLVNIGITVVLLLLYLRHQKAQYDASLDKRVAEAIQDTQALCAWRQQGAGLAEPAGEVCDEGHQE
ncbi:MAG: hypothetical protein ACI36W_04840 [Coriobacteriales bacterium]